MNQLARIDDVAVIPVLGLIASTAEIDLYQAMAKDYLWVCEKRPYMNHCILAMAVGAEAFAIPIETLQSTFKTLQLSESRQKLMAFSRVVSIGTPILNQWRGIGRVFRRTHATVIHATHKYGHQITDAMQGGAR